MFYYNCVQNSSCFNFDVNGKSPHPSTKLFFFLQKISLIPLSKCIFVAASDESVSNLQLPLCFQTTENEGRYYGCDPLPFMEVGSVAHKYYLINIRLPVKDRKTVNNGIGEIRDIRLVVSFPLLRFLDQIAVTVCVGVGDHSQLKRTLHD